MRRGGRGRRLRPDRRAGFIGYSRLRGRRVARHDGAPAARRAARPADAGSARIDAMVEDDGGFEAALREYPPYVDHAKACAAALSRGGAALVIGAAACLMKRRLRH